MSAEIEAQRFLLVREHLHFGPRRRVGQADDCQPAGIVAAEQVGLALITVALHASPMLERAVDGGHELRPTCRQWHA
jgi:hypothetical protein